MAVIFSGVIVQRSLHRCCGLTEGFVTDGMNLDLKAEAVGFFAKFDDPFIRVIEHAPAVCPLIGFQHRRIHGAEAAVHPGQLPFHRLIDIQGLHVYPHLNPVVQARGKPPLQIHVQIQGETHAADGMDHADALSGHIIRRPLHTLNQLYHGDRIGHVVGDGKKSLLVHLASLLMIAPQIGNFLLYPLQQFGVDDAGMSIVFDQEHRPVGTGNVQLGARDQLSIGD